MIRSIEELSMNAWPALGTQHYDGWVLRCAEGYTRRANSVYPLYEPTMELDRKIDFCGSFYRNMGLPPTFKITEASRPSDLDARLEARGYRKEALTSVQILDLRTAAFQGADEIQLSSDDTKEWHEAFAQMNQVNEKHRLTHEKILGAFLLEKCFASAHANGHTTGCGLGILQAGYLGIFDIVIDRKHRRQRLGLGLMKTLLSWGQERSAESAYLQVMRDNGPAIRLYEKLGFEEMYPYWYRVKG